MATLAEEMGLTIQNTSDLAGKIREIATQLDVYGIKDKDVDATPIVETSTVAIAKSATLGNIEFFKEKVAGVALKDVDFPNKTKAFKIDCIGVDLELNLADTTQETLKAMQHYIKHSAIVIKLRGSDYMNIPLDEALPFVIDYDGTNYIKRTVRDGFEIPNSQGIQIHTNGEFEIFIQSATGYTTSGTAVVSAAIPNYVRIKLRGHSLRPPRG